MRRALTKSAGLAIEKPCMSVEAIRQRGGKMGDEQTTRGQHELDQIIEPLVEEDRRIERHNHVDAEEQLAEPFVDMEIDWPLGLIVGAPSVEHRLLAAPVDR